MVEVFVILLRLNEREDAFDQDEQDDSEAEHISGGPRILLSALNLRGHIGHGAHVISTGLDIARTWEPKISELQIKVLINQYVLYFDVPVAEFFTIMHVVHGR